MRDSPHRLERRLDPGEQEAADRRELRRQHRDQRQGAEREDMQQVAVEFAGLGVGCRSKMRMSYLSKVEMSY